MEALRKNAFPVNGGPGSILPTKFGNEEVGGRSGKGCCRLAAALAPPGKTAESGKGGLKVRGTPFSPQRMRFGKMPYPRRRIKFFEENGAHAKPMRGSGYT